MRTRRVFAAFKHYQHQVRLQLTELPSTVSLKEALQWQQIAFMNKSSGFYPLIQILTNFLVFECIFLSVEVGKELYYYVSCIYSVFKEFTGFLYPVKPAVAG